MDKPKQRSRRRRAPKPVTVVAVEEPKKPRRERRPRAPGAPVGKIVRPRNSQPRTAQQLAQQRAVESIVREEQARNLMAIAKQLPGEYSAQFEVDNTIIDTVPIKSNTNRIIRQAYSPDV